MTFYIPPTLRPIKGQDQPTRRANRRELRRLMKDHARGLLENKGYVFGQSLDINRSFAFNATRNGKSVKIGIRSGADRWIALTQSALAPGGELDVIDELVVLTFADAKTRDSIELWRFEAKTVVQMAKQIFAAAGTDGQQWLPLDDTQDAAVHSMIAGSLSKRGELVLQDPVVWKDPTMASADSELIHAVKDSALVSVGKLTIAEAKAALAATYGVDAASIKIIIEG